MKSFFASVECAERGLNPFETNLVVVDESRGNGTICLAITPAMKALGVNNRCRLFEIPKNIKYITAMPHKLLLNKVRKINKPFWTFIIGFEEAKAYHWRNYGVHTHKSKWEDIVVNVYI